MFIYNELLIFSALVGIYIYVLRTLKFHLSIFHMIGWQNFHRIRVDTKLKMYTLPCHPATGPRLHISPCISQECLSPQFERILLNVKVAHDASEFAFKHHKMFYHTYRFRFLYPPGLVCLVLSKELQHNKVFHKFWIKMNEQSPFLFSPYDPEFNIKNILWSKKSLHDV